MNDSPQVPSLTRSQILVAMAVTAIVLWAIAEIWVYLFGVTRVPLHLSLHHLGIGVLLGALIAILSSTVYRVWRGYREAADSYLEMVLLPLEMSDLIWLGLLPGISEELLFRGVALPGLGMNELALAITSIIFGALHMANPKHLPYVCWAAIVGLFLGGTTLVTGSLLPAIVAHVLTNSLSGLLWKLQQQTK